jgi:hypothetical protein
VTSDTVSFWNQHLFIEKRGIDKNEAESTKILIKVLEKNLIKDEMIGMFELDLGFIYLRDQHMLSDQWVSLSNPFIDFSDIRGYLQLSVQVIGPGDEPVELSINEEKKEDMEAMMSPSICPEYYQIVVDVFQGQKLAMMDQSIGILGSKQKIDAYIKV